MDLEALDLEALDLEAPVVYDANVLFPFHVGHILVFMAARRLVNAKWTDKIQQEWLDNIGEKYPEDLDGCRRRRDAMNRALPEAMVTGYESRIEHINFKDPDDRHVIAAALHVGASGIVTRDKKHFTPRTLKPFGLAVINPDDLLVACHEHFPEDCAQTVEQSRRALSVTKPTLEQYLETLDSQKLNRFVRTQGGLTPK